MDTQKELQYQTTIRDLRNAVGVANQSPLFWGKFESLLSRTSTDTGALDHLLAGFQALIAKKDEALEELAKLGNGDRYGNSIGNQIAKTALSIKSPTDALDKIRAEVAAQVLEEAAVMFDGFIEAGIGVLPEEIAGAIRQLATAGAEIEKDTSDMAKASWRHWE